MICESRVTCAELPRQRLQAFRPCIAGGPRASSGYSVGNMTRSEKRRQRRHLRRPRVAYGHLENGASVRRTRCRPGSTLRRTQQPRARVPSFDFERRCLRRAKLVTPTSVTSRAREGVRVLACARGAGARGPSTRPRQPGRESAGRATASSPPFEHSAREERAEATSDGSLSKRNAVTAQAVSRTKEEVHALGAHVERTVRTVYATVEVQPAETCAHPPRAMRGGRALQGATVGVCA